MTQEHASAIEQTLKPIFIEGLHQVRAKLLTDSGGFLRSIFDQIGFIDRDSSTRKYYVPPSCLTSHVFYPVKGDDTILEESSRKARAAIKNAHLDFATEYLEELSANQLFFLLEKYGGNVPVVREEEISIFDRYKIQAAKALIEFNRNEHGHDPGCLLINIDLSGIQPFIYNIVSLGALKNLRARSFFIELLCNHSVKAVLDTFNLHQTNVLMSGGGSITILSSKPTDYRQLLEHIDQRLNSWLLKEFNGRLHVAFATIEINEGDLGGDLSTRIKLLSEEAQRKKKKKFETLIQNGKFPFVSENDPAPDQCSICQNDYGRKPSTYTSVSEDPQRCPFCEQLVRLGSVIPKLKYVYTSTEKGRNCVEIDGILYLLSEEQNDLPCPWVVFDDSDGFLEKVHHSVPIFADVPIVTNAMLPDEVRAGILKEKAAIKLAISEATDAKERRQLEDDMNSLSMESAAALEHLAASAEGAKYIGALRMDADNMGKILQKGFYGNASLEKISAFSRHLNYFFKLYLKGICATSYFDRKGADPLIHVIYSGGDDLCALGTWNDIADVSLVISDAFARYTCNNHDLGLSAGFAIYRPKYPVSKMAELALLALEQSKRNLQPCWFCRKDWIECALYLNGACLRKDSLTPFYTEQNRGLKESLDKLHLHKYSADVSRLKLSFKRSLYIVDSKTKDEVKDLILRPLKIFITKDVPQPGRVFLHNVLRTLQVWYAQGILYLPRIAWLLHKQREHLRSMVHKETELSMYNLYDWNLHFASANMLSALHVPLWWTILLRREGEKGK